MLVERSRCDLRYKYLVLNERIILVYVSNVLTPSAC